jgi:hypothetical protein
MDGGWVHALFNIYISKISIECKNINGSKISIRKLRLNPSRSLNQELKTPNI